MAYLISLFCICCWALAFAGAWTDSEVLRDIGYSPFLFIGGAVALSVYLSKEKHPNKYVYWFNLTTSSALVLMPLGLVGMLLPLIILIFSGGRVHV